MLYSSLVARKGFDAHGQFYALLSHGRYDRALEIREDPKNKIGKEVFLLSSVKDAGREAVLLAIRIGYPEDPKRFQKRFRLTNTIWDDPVIRQALSQKLQMWETMGHPGADRLRRLYPVLRALPSSPRQDISSRQKNARTKGRGQGRA